MLIGLGQMPLSVHLKAMEFQEMDRTEILGDPYSNASRLRVV